jgi:hypothetical protein
MSLKHQYSEPTVCKITWKYLLVKAVAFKSYKYHTQNQMMEEVAS